MNYCIKNLRFWSYWAKINISVPSFWVWVRLLKQCVLWLVLVLNIAAFKNLHEHWTFETYFWTAFGKTEHIWFCPLLVKGSGLTIHLNKYNEITFDSYSLDFCLSPRLSHIYLTRDEGDADRNTHIWLARVASCDTSYNACNWSVCFLDSWTSAAKATKVVCLK